MNRQQQMTACFEGKTIYRIFVRTTATHERSQLVAAKNEAEAIAIVRKTLSSLEARWASVFA